MKPTHLPVALACAVLLAGCSAERRPETVRLEDLFPSRGFETRHNSYHVWATVKPGADAATVVRLLADFVSGKGTAATSDFPDASMQGIPPLRVVDYWALVLAKLTHAPLEIGIHDSSAVRDDKIRGLLQKLKNAGIGSNDEARSARLASTGTLGWIKTTRTSDWASYRGDYDSETECWTVDKGMQ